MKVITYWQQTSIALRGSTFLGWYKNAMWTNVVFPWGFYLWKQIYVFRTI